MWSIKEIKQKGKKTLKNNLWTFYDDCSWKVRC